MAATVVAGNRLARRWARIAEAPPDAASIPCKKICHCEASAHTGCGNPWYPRTAPLVLSPAGHFLPTAAENTQRTPPKPTVLESFARLECRLCGKFSAKRTKCPGLTPCFRIVFAPTAAGLAQQGWLLRLPLSGRRGRRPLHEFREHAPIGAAYIGPPMVPLAKTLSLR